MIRAQKSGGDFVDQVRREWSTTFPDIDTSPIEVLARIGRISAKANHLLDATLAPMGVSRAEFDVLSALRRTGRALRASEVTSVTMLSGASTTKISERLVKEGLIERLRFERDARVVLLQLTDAGRDLVDRVFPVRLERDRGLLDGLDADDLEALSGLLRRVALNVE
ncbi:MarR family transcriptional regulator [Rhodococcus sp. BP-252]|uniref:MarR family transcriptional regulator n=1 Tax=Rhodococcoides kyotonense TaxID=398843 RepID=A0A177YGK2_9NOCA|nr:MULTISPECIES: MarR family transcriptional regulator [Rhodococcus]MBY6414175.1 MarR family transcriptional regulator [Rhodococcus sp. BP-320]MBY6418961.1 MarR family transcriptional regulator [Rhodococcus sp. BP-321]MBY6423714.1 MarR family transcriptional regulator [Rhodococcus sp. BP-324]MBY6428980.1 MarR family transcriptional regulator [Rhodococcus sp. BP-323]MBY6433985.1 MarR family transcriptional regulator [Rhodococcus sp. BP-322]